MSRTEGQDQNNAMRVLVIEDDKETAQFLQKSLKENGHTADLAADGEAGLVACDGRRLRRLIVDRMLPRLDGLSLIKSLRAARQPHAGAHPLGAWRSR